jgi:hypothetical protein
VGGYFCVPNIERFEICAEPLHEMLENRIQDGQAAKVMRVGHVEIQLCHHPKLNRAVMKPVTVL